MQLYHLRWSLRKQNKELYSLAGSPVSEELAPQDQQSVSSSQVLFSTLHFGMSFSSIHRLLTFRMKYQRISGPILPGAFRKVFLVSEVSGISKDSPLPRSESLPQDNPVAGPRYMQQISFDQSPGRCVRVRMRPCVCAGPPSAWGLSTL